MYEVMIHREMRENSWVINVGFSVFTKMEQERGKEKKRKGKKVECLVKEIGLDATTTQ